MAIAEPVYTRGRLSSNITPIGYENLIKILELQKNNDFIPNFKRTIYDLDKEQINYLREYKNNKISDKASGMLEDHQTLAVGFMLHSNDCIIGDSVGLGKTAEISSLINIRTAIKRAENEDFRYVMLTEKSSVIDTTNKLIKFTGESVQELFGNSDKVEKFLNNNPLDEDFTGGISGTHSLVKNSKFHSWIREKTKQNKKETGNEYFIDLLVIDESKVLINSQTDFYKLAFKLRCMCKNVILLNATPFEANLKYWYNQFNFLDKKLMPTYNIFAKRFINFNPTTRRYDGGYGYKEPEVFKHEVSLKYFANTRRTLNAKFEDCEVLLREVSLTNKQRQMMNNTSMPSIVYDCPQMIDESLPFTPDIVSKLSVLDNIILENGFDDGNWAQENPIIIYSYYKASHYLLKEYLETTWGLSCCIINGDITSKKERQDIIESFRRCEVNILITSIYRGLDLDISDILIFYTFTSNPSVLLQTEGRITRSLHVKNKTFYLVITKGKEKQKLGKAQSLMKYNNDYTNPELSMIGSFLLGEDI